MTLSQRLRAFIGKSSLMKDAKDIFLLRSCALLLLLAGNVIIARVLGPEHKGIIDLFTLITGLIAEIGMFGISNGLLYHLTNKGRPLKEIHGTGLVYSLWAGLAALGVGYLTLSFWQKVFPGLEDWILLLAFAVSPLTFYKLIWENIMTGINRAVDFHRLSLYFSATNLAVVIFLWSINILTSTHVIIWALILLLFSSVISFWTLNSQAKGFTPNLKLGKDSLKYGIVIYAGVLANLLHFKIDQTMIAYWLGTGAVGIYTVSVRWAEMLFFLDQALISAAFYKIASSSSSKSYKITNIVFKTQLKISLITGAALALLAYPLILGLYGTLFKGSILPLIILIPGIIAWSTSKVVSNMLTYNMGMASFLAQASFVGCFLNILLNYIFIKLADQGISGAAMASSLSYSLVAISIFIKARKTKDLPNITPT